MDPQDDVLAQRVGQTVGGWVLRQLIGTGGMATVYAADNRSGQIAAVKLLHPEMAKRKEIRERFLLEASVMARIEHPGIVLIQDHGQCGELTYLAMELLVGETIADRVRRMVRLESNEVLVILDQVLDVLAVAHSMGVVHRDLKPENLFLTQSGQVKVLDFGLARLLDSTPQSFRTRTGAALGTLPYMAPEQALGRREEIDARTDLFAVGATAFRLLVGRRIHEAPSEAELLMRMASTPAPALLDAAPDLSSDLGAVVDRALAFAKISRYPDASTMQRDVRALLSGQPPRFALSRREHEESATRVDPLSPNAIASTTVAPNSTRPLHAALPDFAANAPTISERLPRTAPDAAAELTATDAEALSPSGAILPNSQRALPPTVVMTAPLRDAAPLSQPGRAQIGIGASIPTAPISDASLERARRRTLIIALILLFCMFGAVVIASFFLLGRRTTTTVLGDTEPVPASAIDSERTAVPHADSTRQRHAPTEPRHPTHVMTPIEEPPGEYREPAPELRVRRRKSPQPPRKATAATSTSGSIE